jgi:hypothetical protein
MDKSSICSEITAGSGQLTSGRNLPILVAGLHEGLHDRRANRTQSSDLLWKPVIKGIRISVLLILERISENESWKEILVSYPELKTEDIQAAP